MQPDMLTMGQMVLASQPFSVWLGTRLTAFAPGLATLELENRPEFLQQFGLVHGGVLSYLADNAITFAGGTVLGASVLTSEYKINYVRASRGERLIARATVVASSSRQAVCRCDVFAVAAAGTETLCATAQGTIVKTGE